jgi:hypothetical protein
VANDATPTRARKATGRKAAPRKAAPRAAVKRTTGKADTEALTAGAGFPDEVQETPTPTVKASTDTITFRGRELTVRLPDDGVLAVWDRTARRYADITQGQLDAMSRDEQGRLLGRLLGVIRSVLAEEGDRDWLEDELLETDLNLAGAAQIVTLAIEHFQAKNKAKAPTTGPAPKARRIT